MPEQQLQSPVIDYYTPQPRRSWLIGWDWVLLLFVAIALLIWPITRATYWRASEPDTVVLMYLPVAIRAAWGTLRRDRSHWWIAYLLLLFALPAIAATIIEFHDTPLGSRLASAMYHFWRDLF